MIAGKKLGYWLANNVGRTVCNSASSASRFVRIRRGINSNSSSYVLYFLLLLFLPSLLLVPLPLPVPLDPHPTILGVVASSQKNDVHTLAHINSA
jgi:hypothetical protein